MYIEPNTNIKLLKNVPLDNTYEHSLYFDNASDQYEYFSSLQKYNLNNYTYQRVQRGVARVGIKADNLYDCNYLMFQNTSFGDKWFYAFIKSVEYVNNVSANIEFEIDVIQTWWFDWSFGECFVEREHTATDVIGQHIEPEPVEVGELVVNTQGTPFQGIEELAVVMLINDLNTEPDGTLYNGIYCGSTMWVFNKLDVEGIKNKLNDYYQAPDSVVAMYMCPKLFFGDIPDGGKRMERITGAYIENDTGVAPIGSGFPLNGYVPRNQKLYTYPYCLLSINNQNGEELSLRYEFFANNEPSFSIRGVCMPPVSCKLVPANYKNIQGVYNGESITLSNYPMCSWNSDVYKQWVAENGVPFLINTATSLAGAGMELIGGGTGAGGVMSLMNNIGNTLSAGYRASIAAPQGRGTRNNGNVNSASGEQLFKIYHYCVTAQYARCIDDFFDMFGYAVRRVKKPNTNVRPHWCYTKTIGCVVHGSVPADDMRSICRIFDNGITLWKNGSEVGNYSLNNSI